MRGLKQNYKGIIVSQFSGVAEYRIKKIYDN